MKTKRIIRTAALAALVTFLWAVALVAAEKPAGDYADLPDQIEKPEEWKGRKVVCLAKYREIRGEIVILEERPFNVLIPKNASKLYTVIFGLKVMHDNVRVYGVVEKRDTEGYVIRAERMEKAAGDVQVMEKKLAALDKSDLAGREALALWAVKTGEKYENEELADKGRKLLENTYLLEETAAAGDSKRLAALADKYAERMDDEKNAARIYKLAWDLDGNEAARAGLEKLGFKLYKGRWLTYDEYMKAEGMVKYGNEWVSPLEKRFLEIVADRRKDMTKIFGGFTDDYLKRLAEEKRLARGLTPENVAASWGFPKEILDRKVDKDKYLFWNYRDGSFAVFENGLLFRWEKAGE